MLSENQLNLEEAYNTYRQNLAQNEQAVQKSYQEGVSAVDKALENKLSILHNTNRLTMDICRTL